MVPKSPVVAASTAPPPASPGGGVRRFVCERCGKVCKNPGAFGRHKKSCDRKAAEAAAVHGLRSEVPDRDTPQLQESAQPGDTKPLPASRAFDEWRTAAEGADAAEGLIGDSGSVVEVIAKMEADSVGIPDMIALVCLRALPPPLSDDEYRMLRVAYKDNEITISPWLMTALITLAVLGPRSLAHPQLGPWIREKLTGSDGSDVAPAAAAAPANPPPPPPVVTPPPPPPPPDTATAAKERIKRKMQELKT